MMDDFFSRAVLSTMLLLLSTSMMFSNQALLAGIRIILTHFGKTDVQMGRHSHVYVVAGKTTLLQTLAGKLQTDPSLKVCCQMRHL